MYLLYILGTEAHFVTDMNEAQHNPEKVKLIKGERV